MRPICCRCGVNRSTGAATGLVPDVLFLRMRNAMTTQKYRQDSRTLPAQARRELAIGDVRQASEKGWGPPP